MFTLLVFGLLPSMLSVNVYRAPTSAAKTKRDVMFDFIPSVIGIANEFEFVLCVIFGVVL